MTTCKRTVFLVEQDLYLCLLHVFKRTLDLVHRLLVRQVAVHKTARAALLHDLGPVIPRQLTEPVIAVDDGVVHDPGICQQEAAICNQKETKLGVRMKTTVSRHTHVT